MIRPFYIEIYKPKRGKLISHRGDYLSNNIISVNDKFLNKIFSHPITAFAYQIGGLTDKIQPSSPNTRFDKHDVIKALDFWIDYFVYQNKCDYILEGTVDKDFELTVRELIETREAVLKCPADTEYVRQKIRVSEIGTQHSFEYSDDIAKLPEFVKDIIVEFTENVVGSENSNNSSISTVDQFCYKVVKMTHKEYIMKKNGLPYTIRANIDNLQRAGVLPE